jgi:hypothetical protein
MEELTAMNIVRGKPVPSTASVFHSWVINFVLFSDIC